MRGGLHRPDPCRVSQVAYSRRVPAFHVEGLQRLRTVESAFGTCPSCISVPLLPHVNGWGVTREAEPAASGGERSGRRPPPSSSRRLSAPLPNQQDRGSGWGDCVHLRHPLRAPNGEWEAGGGQRTREPLEGEGSPGPGWLGKGRIFSVQMGGPHGEESLGIFARLLPNYFIIVTVIITVIWGECS